MPHDPTTFPPLNDGLTPMPTQAVQLTHYTHADRDKISGGDPDPARVAELA
jgi:hypothetical protein